MCTYIHTYTIDTVMVSSRFKKMNRSVVPSLQLGGEEATEPTSSGRTDSIPRNHRKESSFHGGFQPSRSPLADMQRIPLSTPRGTTSSYKDILLTPRMGPRQQAEFHGFQTSRASSPGQGARPGVLARSPLTARAPRRGARQQRDALGEVNREERRVSETLYTLARQVEELERDNANDGEVARSISKSIQVAASMIGVPVGILEMLQMHEQQRMTSRIQAPTRVVRDTTPRTPDHSVHLGNIRTKISDIERMLQDMS